MPKENIKTKKKSNPYIFAVGRRREAVARVRIYNLPRYEIGGQEYKRGDFIVNGKNVTDYFRFKIYTPGYQRVLRDAGVDGKFIISAKVEGGGLSGQLDAIVLGIARALVKQDPEKYKKILKEKGYMTRDPRTRERRKVGMGGKARRKKQSPKR